MEMVDCKLGLGLSVLSLEPNLNFTSSTAIVSVDIPILHTLWQITQKCDDSDPAPLSEAVLIRYKQSLTVVAKQTTSTSHQFV